MEATMTQQSKRRGLLLSPKNAVTTNHLKTMETFEYTTLGSKPITEQQLPLVKDYLKKIYIDGNLKKVERYLDNQFFLIKYFVDQAENFEALKTQFQDQTAQFYINKTISNGYTAWDIEVFDKGTLSSNGKFVVDDKGRNIYSKSVRVNGNLVLFHKLFYLDNHEYIPNDEYVFWFRYAANNNLNAYINTKISEWAGSMITLGELQSNSNIRQFFRWEEQTYYHSGEPAIPGAPIV